uniref:anthranilate synthase component I family protein n=1 Tax=uncultured Moraxella sp. TaxID=263769 RepID=UPI0025CF7DF2
MTDIIIPSTLSTAELTCAIAHRHADWQVCFLNNHHKPMIGILPKISWQMTSHAQAQTLTIATRQAMADYRYEQLPSSYEHLMAQLCTYADTHKPSPDMHDTEPSYQHGLMGFVGYDIAAHALNDGIGIDESMPACFFGHYDIILRPCTDGYQLICHDNNIDIDTLGQMIGGLGLDDLPKKTALTLTPLWSKADYAHAFDQAQAYLLAGDGYQINLTQAWQAKKTGALSAHLPSLLQQTNAPFAGFLQVAGFELLSVSPELFFTFYQQNHQINIITKPIKGTRPRASDPAADDALKQALATSSKDISENLMIVDLLRNDLGKYAITGGVKTPVRFAIESFYNVHHMVSTITATLKPDSHPIAVLFGSLPAGSITGAPKKRACEMIDELEARPRGAYCGTMGYLNFDGTGQFNVLIRTIQANADTVSVWAGGGITIRSQMDDEYQECLDKVGAILK